VVLSFNPGMTLLSLTLVGARTKQEKMDSVIAKVMKDGQILSKSHEFTEKIKGKNSTITYNRLGLSVTQFILLNQFFQSVIDETVRLPE
jgi:hypothetical protein